MREDSTKKDNSVIKRSEAEPKPREVFIEMSVRVSDDSFESSLKFPVEGSTKESIQQMFLGWMGALDLAMKAGGVK